MCACVRVHVHITGLQGGKPWLARLIVIATEGSLQLHNNLEWENKQTQLQIPIKPDVCTLLTQGPGGIVSVCMLTS